MSPIWIVSMVLQWLLFVGMLLLLLSVVRQIGVLTLRINAMGSSGGDGPNVYTQIPKHTVQLLNGDTFQLGGERPYPTLVLFFSPGCGPCSGLDVVIHQYVKKYVNNDASVLVVLMTERSTALDYLNHRSTSEDVPDQPLKDIATVAKEDFPEQYVPLVNGPYSFSLTTTGIVAARGKGRTPEVFRQMVYAARNIADAGTPGALRAHDWGESAPYWELDGALQGGMPEPAGVGE